MRPDVVVGLGDEGPDPGGVSASNRSHIAAGAGPAYPIAVEEVHHAEGGEEIGHRVMAVTCIARSDQARRKRATVVHGDGGVRLEW